MSRGRVMPTGRRALLLLPFLFLVVALAGAESWLYAVRGEQYAVLDPQSGDTVHSGILSVDGYTPSAGAEVTIVPTPGGRYVFFHIPSDDVAVVVDAESHQPARVVALPDGVQSLQFSSMGDTAYLLRDGDRVAVPHRRGELESEQSAGPELAPGLVAFNRRATRVFGQQGRDLIYARAAGGDPIADVSVGNEVHDWYISPNFRYLLGAAQSGDGLVLVDEQRARVTGRVREEIVPRSVGFSDSSREFFALLAGNGGSTIIVGDVPRARIRDRLELDRSAVRLFRDTDGAFFVLYTDGSVGIGAGSDAERIATTGIDGGASDLALVVLKPGQGFACF